MLLALLLSAQISVAQHTAKESVLRIDSLTDLGLPKSAMLEVDQLEQLARKENNPAEIVRAAIYRIKLMSYLEDDRFDDIIGRIKNDITKSTFPIKPILQSLLAEIHWKYYQQNRYKISQRSKTSMEDPYFRNWDLSTLLARIGHLYDQSLNDYGRAQKVPIAIFQDILIGDKATRYLRPTLYDLLLNRALDFFLLEEPTLPKPLLLFSIDDKRFFGRSQAFADINLASSDTSSTVYKGIKYLQQATQFHLNDHNAAALAHIDLIRLSFLHLKTTLPDKDQLYLQALSIVATGIADQPINTDALYLIGMQHYQKNNLASALIYFEKATSSYPETLGGKNAVTMIDLIKSKYLRLGVEPTYSPNQPLLASVNFRSVEAVQMQLYHLSDGQLKQYKERLTESYTRDQDPNKSKQLASPILQLLQQFKRIQQKTIDLPSAKDYLLHTTEFNIDPLKTGNYLLLLNEANASDSSLLQLADFKVSGMNYTSRVNPDGTYEMVVIDRENGKPLKDVKVKISKKDKDDGDSVYVTGITQQEGRFKTNKIISGSTIELILIQDTLQYSYVSYAEIYKEPETHPATILFTDRQIYRPGQTVYFKGLQIETANGKSKIMPGEDVQIKMTETQGGKTISETTFKTNEFGTFSGSFVIPTNTLLGLFRIGSTNGANIIMSEEYKRPTFVIGFDTLKGRYNFNDRINVTGKVLANAGYGLSKAKVSYAVVRNIDYGSYGVVQSKFKVNEYLNHYPQKITTDTVSSDDEGNFNIRFKALPGDEDLINKGLIYNYTITANVTDGTGETQSGSTSINIGTNDLLLQTELPEKLTVKDSAQVTANLTTLNGQKISGTVTVEAYSLDQPGRVFKSSVYIKPDLYLLSKADYQNMGYAYADEDDSKTWKVKQKVFTKVVSIEADSHSTNIDLRPLKKLNSGLYKIVMRAKSSAGDTAFFSQIIQVLNQPAIPFSMNDWVTPVNLNVANGEDAELIIGIGEPVHVLMEIYQNTKLRSSQWLKVDKKLRVVQIPVGKDDENLAVQMLMNYKNRQYASYHQINIQHPEKTLHMRMLSFRNKLIPGEKEAWKMEILGNKNEKLPVEIVATLYDASMGKLPFNRWQYYENTYKVKHYVWNHMGAIYAGKGAIFPFAKKKPVFLYSNTYENLNYFGYGYFGDDNYGYRQYLQAVTERKEQLAYAKLTQNGYEIDGQITDLYTHIPLSGASILYNNVIIATTANNGKFRVKVPENSMISITASGYGTLLVPAIKGVTLNLPLIPGTIPTETSKIKFDEAVRYYTPAMQYNKQGYSSLSYGRFISQQDAVASAEELRGGGAVNFASVETPPKYKDWVGSTKFPANLSLHESLQIRKNFNETAFFYPHLRSDKNGQVMINFTMPESLTKWKFKAFTHTKELATSVMEADVVTQKQLMITANMPRFLREGDTLTVSARLANLSRQQLKGKVQLAFFDALSMQQLPDIVVANIANQNFELDSQSNKALSFKIIVPSKINALTYRISAVTDQYSDGEENTLPVFSSRLLVTESMPMTVRAGEQKSFRFDKLLNIKSSTIQSNTLTLTYAQNPAWYAVQALPYLSDYPDDCSEQIFSRYYANSFAAAIVKDNPLIQQVFAQWKLSDQESFLSNLEKNQELKSVLLAETPWLRDAQNETEQKQRIALLLDLNNNRYNQIKIAEQLQKIQLPDGSFPWFGGRHTDRYITQHIIAGMGQLFLLKIADSSRIELIDIRNKALKYLDNELLNNASDLRQPTNGDLNILEIHGWYARSYFPFVKLSNGLRKAKEEFLERAIKQWKFRSIYDQALIAFILHRNGETAATQQIIRSLQETSQQTAELGMYWAKNKPGYFWYQSPVETQSILIALFQEVGADQKSIDEMKIWLLGNKQTNNWGTTKATAAACYALLMKKGDGLLSASPTTRIMINNQPLSQLKSALKEEVGTGYINTSWTEDDIKPALGEVEITNTSKNINWGALYWQYTEKLDKVTAFNTDIQLERKYFVEQVNSSGAFLQLVDAQHQPKVGEVLKVVIYLKANRDFDYIHLKDMRPAGTEPMDVLSAYKYQDGLSYYEVAKDVATNFFISRLNKGSYVFEYRLRVAQQGNFATGITSVQSMYAPEFNAHSEGKRMQILK
ncbi:MAG: alpha-2-macroglobulin family protein [Sphingobacteriaceae bacterium]